MKKLTREQRNRHTSDFPSGDGFEALIRFVCIDMGYCGSSIEGEPSHISDFIPDTGTVSADQFVEWMLLAEGMEPILVTEDAIKLRKAFLHFMGAETVLVESLKFP